MKRETSTKGESPKAKKSELDVIPTGSSESTSSIGHPQLSSYTCRGKIGRANTQA